MQQREESSSDKKIVWALILCHLVCPLIFFTDLTRNPYFTQIVLLNLGILAAATLYLWNQKDAWRIPRTPLNLPFICWFVLCLFSTGWSYTHHAPFFRDSIYAEGLRVTVFSIVNVLLPFFIAASCVRECPAEPDVKLGWWVGFVVVWGLLWMFFDQMRSAGGPPMSVWTHLWDPYGAFLWIFGFVAVATLVRKGTAHQYWHLILTVGFLSSMYGILQYFNTEFIWPRVLNPYGGRAVSTFGNPNFMASYMAMLLPMAAAYYLKARNHFERAVYAVVFLALEACVVSSLTRSCWMGALTGVAILFLSPELRKRARENLEIHGLALALAVAIMLLWPSSTVQDSYASGVLGRIKELQSSFDTAAAAPYSPLYQRVLIWSCMWLMGNENPLWGKGWGVLELFYPFYQGHVLSHFDLFRTMRTHANNAHNEILELWSQTGILGVGMLFWIWITFFVSAWKWYRAGENNKQDSGVWTFAAMAGVAGMLVDNLLNVSLHFAVPAFLFWWQVGMVMGRPAHTRGEEGWRIFRFPNRASAVLAFGVVVALCAQGGWWWVRQWKRDIHYFMGFKLAHAGILPKAIEQLESAHRWHSREVNANYELGNAYARSEKFDKAVWAYREALKSNAGYDEIYFNTATLLAQRLNDRAEGLKYYLTSYAINPLSQDVYATLGTFYLQEPAKYQKSAIELFRKGLHYFPEQTSFMNNLGYLYRLDRQFVEAEKVLTQALRINPEFELAERNLRETCRESKRPLPDILQQVQAYRDLEASIVKKDYSAAVLQKARQVAAWFSKSMKAHFYLGNLEYVHGRPDAALAHLEPLVAMDTKNIALLRNLADIYIRLNRVQDAVRAFQMILEADPQNAYARSKLSELSSLP